MTIVGLRKISKKCIIILLQLVKIEVFVYSKLHFWIANWSNFEYNLLVPDLSKHRLSFFFLILFSVLGATFFAIKFASGYRLDLANKTLKPTGILVTNSHPDGARVFVNGKFVAATNGTISLKPGKYTIEIKKNGFLPWKKDLVIEKELVSLAEAFLFPEVPDLKPLTFSEVNSPQISPDNTKIVYSIPLPDLNAGLWILDLTDSLFNFSKSSRQIAKSRTGSDFANSNYSWSPDSRQILVEFPSSNNKYLLEASQLNQLTAGNEVSNTLPKTKEDWQKEENLKEKAKLKRLPLKMLEIVASKAAELQFSPDSTKILYLATASAEIPEKLIPPVLAVSTQKESRQTESGKLYVYDIKEDHNFLIPFDVPKPTPTPKLKKSNTPTPIPLTTHYPGRAGSLLTTPQWFPTSKHLVWIVKDKIVSCEYDGTNLTTIYSGPFTKPYVFIAPSTDKLVILTKIGAEEEDKSNLYIISLR